MAKNDEQTTNAPSEPKKPDDRLIQTVKRDVGGAQVEKK